MNRGHIFCPGATARSLKQLDTFVHYKHTSFQFTRFKIRLELCGLLVDYCDLLAVWTFSLMAPIHFGWTITQTNTVVPIPILVLEFLPIPQRILASVSASTWTHVPIRYHFLKQDLYLCPLALLNDRNRKSIQFKIQEVVLCYKQPLFKAAQKKYKCASTLPVNHSHMRLHPHPGRLNEV